MTTVLTTTVTLDPTTELDTIQKYEQDKGWRKLSETTIAYVFESTSPYYNTEAVYMPSRKEQE